VTGGDLRWSEINVALELFSAVPGGRTVAVDMARKLPGMGRALQGAKAVARFLKSALSRVKNRYPAGL
jgi:hypothetical protein